MEQSNPVYKDFSGDTRHRDFDGVLAGLHYINNTGRNDIIESRVARDNASLYFYVKTTDPISSYKNKKTGWQGYDYVINTEVISDSLTTLKKWNNSHWEMVQKLSYRLDNNEMEVKVPLAAMKIYNKQLDINFHLADNIQKLDDITEFFTNGDSAPERRFDYHYQP